MTGNTEYLRAQIQGDRRSYETSLSEDLCTLNIEYGPWTFGDIEYDGLSDFLNDLDVRDTLTSLKIDHDGINHLPACMLDFQKLTDLDIDGTRFWTVNFKHLPDTLTHLRVSVNNAAIMSELPFLPSGIQTVSIFSNDTQNEDYDNECVDRCISWPPLPELPFLKSIVLEDWAGQAMTDLKRDRLIEWTQKYQKCIFDCSNGELTIVGDTDDSEPRSFHVAEEV